ncbi:hypothetical protein [Streptomyces fructofermentans]|uniref:hypothetical protein n=1 Tax=Streptomyces fructofermentans TaxID=152141 RepID=UPI0037B5F2D5
MAPRLAAELASTQTALRVESVRLAGSAARALLFQGGDAEKVVPGVRDEGGWARPVAGFGGVGRRRAAACPVVRMPGGPARASPGRRPDKVTPAVDARYPADGAIGFGTR